jgi:hypothetical protein
MPCVRSVCIKLRPTNKTRILERCDTLAFASHDHGGASGNGKPSRSTVSRPCRSHRYALGTPPFVSFIEGESEQSRQFVSTRSLILSLCSLNTLSSGKVVPGMRTGYRIWVVLPPSASLAGALLEWALAKRGVGRVLAPSNASSNHNLEAFHDNLRDLIRRVPRCPTLGCGS